MNIDVFSGDFFLTFSIYVAQRNLLNWSFLISITKISEHKMDLQNPASFSQRPSAPGYS